MRRSRAITTVGAAVWAAATPMRGRAQAPEKITVGALGAPDMASLYYGLQAGSFAKAGLDISVQPMPNGAAAMAALLGGSVNIAVANILTLAQAYQRGIPIRLLAPSGTYSSEAPGAKLLVADDSPIRSAKDLDGKTVAVVSLHDLMAVAIQGWLKSGGADPDKVHFVEIPPGAMTAALTAKRIDAMAVYEPFLSAAEAAGARTLGKPYDSIAQNFTVTAWFAVDPWAKEHRSAVLAFAETMDRLSTYTNGHYDELIPMIAQFSKLPPETLRRMVHPIIARSLAAAPIQPPIDAAARFHEIATTFPARQMVFPGAP